MDPRFLRSWTPILRPGILAGLVAIAVLAVGCAPGIPGPSAGPLKSATAEPVASSTGIQDGRTGSATSLPAAVTPDTTTGGPMAVAPAASDFPAGTWADPAIVLRVPILMYHVVGPGLDAPKELPDLVVPTAAFDAQMTALSDAGWTTITMGQLAEDLRNGVRPPPRTFVVTVDDGHVDGLSIIVPILARLGFRATFYIVPGRLGHNGYLTQDQVRALVDAGMDVGNHTVHHLDLATLSASRLYSEIGTAESILGDMTGVDPVTLAYPYGQESAAAVDVTQSIGVALAVTTQYGALENWADRLTLPRVRIHGHSTAAEVLAAVAPYAG